MVRENTVALRPPRALWVPFDLGRPFGAPAEPVFQAKVLDAVLALLERDDGPVILEDFGEDAPGQGSPEAMEGMVCPVPLPKPRREQPHQLIDQVLKEIDDLAAWHELTARSRANANANLSGLSIRDAAHFLDTIRRTGSPPTTDQDQWGRQLRFAAEDLRNYFLAATLSRPGGAASPRDSANWFWAETSAAALLLALHPICLASDNEGIRLVAETQLVPRAQRHRLAASND